MIADAANPVCDGILLGGPAAVDLHQATLGFTE